MYSLNMSHKAFETEQTKLINIVIDLNSFHERV